MVDLMQAAQDVVYALLEAADRAQDATVLQHVPENTQPPLVIVGDMDAESQGEKSGGLDLITVDVHSIYRGTARRPLLAMMADNRTALDGAQPDDLDGVSFSSIRWIASSTATGADGVTYAGAQQFQVFVEPA